MGQEIRAVLFDVGGVIATQDERAADTLYERARPGLTASEVNRTRHGTELYPLWVAYSVSEIDSHAYWAAVAAALCLGAGSGEALRSAHAATVWSVLDPGVGELIAALRRHARVRLGILSNSAPECEGHVPSFAGPFDVMHFSHRTRRRKPDADAYLAACADLGAPPREVMFVDDKSRNVGAAALLGMPAIEFRGVAALASDLSESFPSIGGFGDTPRPEW